MHRPLVRSTPARVTIILGVAFFAALALAAGLAFLLIRQELANRNDRAILDTFSVITESYGDGDITDLKESVASHVRAAIEDDRVYLLRDAAGTKLAGNFDDAPAFTGWLTLPAHAVRASGSSDYRLYSGPIADYSLIVGVGLNETDEIGRLVLSSLAWAGVGFVTLVIATGLIVAARAQHRLDAIGRTMDDIGRGQLGARIPISRRGDDIDELSIDVNAALDRLSALVEGMRQVSVDIAHELKTPLNRMGIALEAALTAAERGENVGAMLEQAQGEARQLNATFDALLRIAQIESGARRARFRPLDVTSILGNLAEAYEPVAGEAGQTLTLEAPAHLPEVSGDGDLLTQMLANLIENAIRHCPKGSSIALRAWGGTDGAVVSVSDTGPGIPADERGKVFHRLYRLEKSRTTKGSGLGLSLVHAIADLHGARVTLSDNNPGLVAEVRFPPIKASTH